MGAEFTETSMIGFIALAGIIVRNSILLVDYYRQEISQGVRVREAIIMACITRTRPIIITALALVVGSFAILFDPIFQGMAISLMFGVFVSTILTLIVIPLGCYSGRAAFAQNMSDDHPDYQSCLKLKNKENTKKSSLIGKVIFALYTIIVTIFQVLWWLIQWVFKLIFNKKSVATPVKTAVKSVVETKSESIIQVQKTSEVKEKVNSETLTEEIVSEKLTETKKSAPKKKAVTKKSVTKKASIKKVVKKKARRGIQLKGGKEEDSENK
jgi:predicted RND superfamily exporter protein